MQSEWCLFTIFSVKNINLCCSGRQNLAWYEILSDNNQSNEFIFFSNQFTVFIFSVNRITEKMQNIWFDVYDNESFNLIAFCDFSIIICVYLFVINTNKLLLEVHFYYRIFVSITVFLFQLPYFLKLNKLWRYFMRPCFYEIFSKMKIFFGYDSNNFKKKKCKVKKK